VPIILRSNGIGVNNGFCEGCAGRTPEPLEGMAKYGMAVEQRLGVSVPDMRKLAKEIGKDHKLALDLWRNGIAEARIVVS
jgi:3-methyladenine DNA glycosylase AlkD